MQATLGILPAYLVPVLAPLLLVLRGDCEFRRKLRIRARRPGSRLFILVVALSVITLFVPCLANFLVAVQEQGARTAALLMGFITLYTSSVGIVFNLVQRESGWPW